MAGVLRFLAGAGLVGRVGGLGMPARDLKNSSFICGLGCLDGVGVPGLLGGVLRSMLHELVVLVVEAETEGGRVIEASTLFRGVVLAVLLPRPTRGVRGLPPRPPRGEGVVLATAVVARGEGV